MKRIAFPAALLTITIATAGCTDDKSKVTGANTTKGAATAPATATVGPVTLPEDPAGLVATIGRQVKAARSLHAEVVTTASDGSKEEASGDLRTDTSSPTAQLKIAQSGATYAVVINGVIYARAEGTEFEPGKPWCRLSRQEIEAAQLGPMAKILTTIIDGVDQSLREVSTDTGLLLVKNGKFTKKAATEQMKGVAVHRYEGTTATNAMPGQEFQKMNSSGLKDVPWILWVDDKGLPQKYTVSILDKQDAKVAVGVTYSKWGVPVNIQPPPVNQVATLQG
jgi:hypothetical protein